MQNTMPMTKEEFWKLYWFSPLQLVTLVNPKSYDYPFMFENRNFIIRRGSKEVLPGTVANLYLSQMSRIMAQDDDKLHFMSDFALMKNYYDELIVTVKSTVQDIDNTPAYLKDMPAHMHADGAPEVPPWQQPPVSASPFVPETNSNMKNALDSPQEPAESPTPPKAKRSKPQEGTKSFDYEGAKYESITDSEGLTLFSKDGAEISESDYSKAASML